MIDAREAANLSKLVRGEIEEEFINSDKFKEFLVALEADMILTMKEGYSELDCRDYISSKGLLNNSEFKIVKEYLQKLGYTIKNYILKW